MEAFLLFVVLVVLLIRWWVLSQRYAEMEQRISTLSQEQVDPGVIAQLTRRIFQLEGAVAELKAGRGEPTPAVPVAEPEPQPETPKPQPLSAAPLPLPAMLPPEPVVPPLEPPPAPAPPPVALPTFAAPVPPRPSRSSEEWEALVGGNWLNKLGILVLVIAIALFLGYSFTQLGHGGRAAIGLAVSIALLAGGVTMERRPRYVIFARGLLAGGWAGLYFTTYAMQAVEAAKVIYNPVLGAFLLLAVAAGMVLHSLRYRVQALTGLAYLVAFATLAITPVTALSVVALVPLAGSLLLVAQRFSWSGLVLFGLAATYGTCASKGDNGAPLWAAQTVFAAYWLLFETYDILRAYRRSNAAAEQVILPLNALGFGALSYAKWSAAAPAQIHWLASGMAAAYLASTVLRAVLRPPASFPAETTTLERILAGAYEGPITLAAAFSAAAAGVKLHGQTVNTVLLAEGELLFLAGFVFRQSYPRRLAGTLFAALGFKLIVTDIPDAGTVQFAGRTLQDWTPSAALAAATFYINRSLRRIGVRRALSYGYAGSALVALAIGFEVSMRHLGLAWLGLGALLFVFGWRFRLFDFRMQAYVAGVLAVGALWRHQIGIGAGTVAPWEHWLPLAAAGVVAYVAAVCALRSAADRFTDNEREALQTVASAVASAAAAALVWRTVPAVYLGPAWIALGILALELGLRRWPPDLRTHAHILASLGAARVLFFTILPFHAIGATDERVAIAWAALLAYAFAARIFVAGPEEVPAGEARSAVNIASACGTMLAMIELWVLLDPMAVAPVWAVFALLLMEIGFRADLPGLRLQGHAAAAAAFGRLFAANLEPGGYSFGISHRLWSTAVVIASHYFEWWRQGRWNERLREWERSCKRPYLYTAAALLTGLMYLELRPPFIAVGWALLALLLLVLGRFRDIADLKFQSYALGALAFGRALSLELFSPETFANLAERVAAGAAVAGCLFLAQLFLPRPPRTEAAETGTEWYGRVFYSLIATVFVTALLYHEVSGSMLTVAWGIEGAALLAAGFPLRDRTLRLSGLALFLVCIAKLFFYDLRQLETLYRILSFFVLGVILVSVSWLYTRFRDRIQRYL
jgi:hypothetical protein